MKLYNKKIEIISSIPGRIRLNIEGLSKEEKLGYQVVCLFQELRGTKNVSFSRITGNILVLYNEDCLNEGKIIEHIKNFDFTKCLEVLPWTTGESIGKIISKSLNPFHLIGKKYSEKIYKTEYILSKRLIKVGFLLGLALFIFTSYSMNILSIGILAYPGILFAIASATYYYTAEIFKYHSIFIKKSETLGLMGRTTDIFIQDQVLLKEEKGNSILLEKDFSKAELQRCIVLGKINKPVTTEGETIIQELRKYGILNITLYTRKKDVLTEYLAYYLGIEDIHHLSDEEGPMAKESSNGVKLLVIQEDLIEDTRKTPRDVTIIIPKKLSKKIRSQEVVLLQKEFIRFPQILQLSGSIDELITRSQVTAVTINVIALFLTIMRQIHPFTALSIYGMNMFAQLIILQNNTQREKGVLYNAYE
ncbi:hypothetical protein CACET_c29540 [Clostridium aceticum]|uniref:Uncharacterized protein n=1 Tax=Clostridium aceticum TaxID=84022 RepID=A0A0D8IAB0_9CLOT|nr:hypothetical protein [Clostridium aceticum]AKL96398.1 hypothetical protein CACET_c29540 [Clostridium aceticum]KJF26974.1 hypothetical protein TZ02_10640 [Clostridium aceticum]